MPKSKDEAELGKAIAEQAIQAPDPYQQPAPPGPNPGGLEAWLEVIESLKYKPPLVRNMAVGPLVISTCVCPRCGELFVYYAENKGHSHNNAYTVCLAPDENPICGRCTYATAWPNPSEQVIEAMVELRWLYDQHLEAAEVASMKSQAQQREAFVRAYDAFWLRGPALLVELEHIFGDQVKAGVAAIEGGVSGVEEQATKKDPAGPAGAGAAGDRPGVDSAAEPAGGPAGGP